MAHRTDRGAPRAAALAAAALAALISPPAPAAAPLPLAEPAAAGALACRAREILEARCARCHGRDGAAAKGVDVLDLERLVASGALAPGDAGSPLLRMVDTGAMPLGGPPLEAAERETLRAWVLAGAPRCDDGAPAAREHLDEPALLGRVMRDLERAPSRSRPYLRYVSLAHLYNAGVPDEDLARYRAGLSKLLNSLSWRRAVAVPAPVGDEGAVVRVDLRDYGISPDAWRRVEALYPYALESASEAITRATGASVPYVRGDWLASVAAEPPLYYELLGLPGTVEELERMLGVDAARNIAVEHGVLRAGVRQSGVSQNNRVVERHESPFGAYWKSYDFRAVAGSRDIFADPVRLAPDGGEMIFSLPNGLQGYFLADGAGRRVDAGPLDIVSDRNHPEDPVIRAGRSCIACHSEGVKPVADDVRAAALAAGSASFDRAKALALYPPQAEVDRALAEDAGRFRAAVEQAGGAADSPDLEPVGALARRYQADLGVAAAAAELGLTPEELLERLRLQGEPARLGLGQLLAPGGGIKRALWEARFADVARGLGVGAPDGERTRLARAGGPAPDSWRATRGAPAAGAVPRPEPSLGPAAGASRPDDVLRLAERVFIRTKTRFFSPALLADALRGRPEFARMRMVVVEERGAADVEILVDRPLFTYTYTFTVTSVRTSAVVASGKLVAFDGNVAAPKIADRVVEILLAARAR